MRNLADLKRAIILGVKILKVDSGVKVATVGTVRTVDKVQTNAFRLGGAWLYWRKAASYEISGDTFSVYQDPTNNSLDNLEIITRAELAKRNQRGTK